MDIVLALYCIDSYFEYYLFRFVHINDPVFSSKVLNIKLKFYEGIYNGSALLSGNF